MWWAYLHQNGKWHLKRWFGDVRDYTDDVRDNDFVLCVVEPFHAPTREAALAELERRVNWSDEGA